MKKKKFNILNFQEKKRSGEKITMLTAYDHSMASIIDECGIDSILVGDSVGMVMLGYDSTIEVTMEDMLHHARAVRRGVKNAFVIGDMPFMSYQASDRDAVINAGRFLKEAGCQAVKTEGGREMAGRIRSIVDAGIPVLGHVGLTPQSINKLGGFRVQGRDKSSARRLMASARALEEAGCFAVVLECVPEDLATELTRELSIPTIGIGAGRYCDGQVLVSHDIVGYFKRFVPKFVKQYADISSEISRAVNKYKDEVLKGDFPDKEHSF